MNRILFIFGTRPEAIKLCPLIRQMRTSGTGFEISVCVTAQHREMLDQVLACFEVTPDYDLDLMTAGQTLSGTTAGILTALDPILTGQRFDLAIVQGDTTTTMAGAMGAFYRRIPVGHVEAGLRTGDLAQPFPEELNRVVTTRLAAIHFAPTGQARANLLAEGVPAERVHVTGNTGIDAVLGVKAALAHGRLPTYECAWLDPQKKLVLATAHRRENFGKGIEEICTTLAQLSEREDIQIIYPVHRNPNVLDPVTARLSGRSNILLLEPLDYPAFVSLMCRARLLITDSGGIQEEAPSLGKPVLVMRERTERPEGVESGIVRLVGTDPAVIIREANRLLDDEKEYRRISVQQNPYGDGRASERIAEAIVRFVKPTP